MDNEKKLNLMKFWLFGSILLIFVATIVYIGGAWGTGLAIFGVPQFWLSMGISVILAVGVYYAYKRYLGN